MGKSITRKQLREIIRYNPRTGEFFWTKRRAGVPFGKAGGRCKRSGYRFISIYKKRIPEHRLAFLYMTGVVPVQVDHINGVRDDNRWYNLRPATSQENNRNKRKMTCATGVKGVTRRKDTGAYQVQIRAEGKKLYLGCYKSLELAELIAIEAREHYHGDFARHE